MTEQFSPAPWRVMNGSLDVWAVERRVSAYPWGDERDAEGRANAALIASAPELYDALTLIVKDVSSYEAWQRPCHALDVALAVLAKAAGGER